MKMKILVTRPVFPDVILKLRDYFDVEVNEKEKYHPAQLKEALRGKDGVLLAGGERMDADLVRDIKGLRAVCVTAAGYNHIDVDALTRAGILATNSPGPADETVADFAWGMMIALARRMTEAERWVMEGHWIKSAGSRFYGTDVYGKTLGIMGMGRIGAAIARRATGFRMRTVYHNRHRRSMETEKEIAATYLSKEQLLAEADFIVLCMPYTSANHHLIGKAEFGMMKRSSFLINIARGGLIDEAALAKALKNKEIGGAALDVFEREPQIHPELKECSNIILTPHIAGATEITQHGLTMMAADNLIAALGLGPRANHPDGVLNPELLQQKP
jgi:lactate dehydrogenase-like 2-hydroxyacid dehydrogenase